MARLGIRYDLLAHESDILRLHFWDRAFELLKESGAIRLETEGKNKGCWVLTMGGRGRRRRHRRGQDHRPLQRHRDLHGQGHRLPALEARASSTATSATAATASTNGHVLWTTTSGEGESGRPRLRPRRPGLQRHRRGPDLPAAGGEGGGGGARPPRGGRAAATTSPTRRSCSPPPPPAPWATRSRRTRARSRSRAARAWG